MYYACTASPGVPTLLAFLCACAALHAHVFTASPHTNTMVASLADSWQLKHTSVVALYTYMHRSLTLPLPPSSALLRSCWEDIPPSPSPGNGRTTNRRPCCLESPTFHLSESSGRRPNGRHSRTKPRTG